MKHLLPHLKKTQLPMLNIALRGGALVGRFVLMLYLVKIFTFEQIGLFGLIVALLASAPAVVGWGLNYFVNRDLVGQPRLLAGRMMRDRLTVTLASAGLVGLLLLLVQLGGFYSLSFALLLLVMGLLVVEMLAYDLHYHLLSLKQPLLANAVMFIRTAAWVAPFVALSWWLPTLQNLTSLLAAWLMGGLLALITLAYAFRGWPLKAIWQQPIDRAWLKEKLGQNKLIYLNDLSFVVMGFFYRVVIENSLGLAATGIYVMYWQMANAVYLLASTGSLQIEAPKLVQAWKDRMTEGGVRVWDQGEFNSLAKLGLRAGDAKGLSARRLFWSFEHRVVGGVLPLASFAGGHAHFVSQMAARRGEQPYSVHGRPRPRAPLIASLLASDDLRWPLMACDGL